MHSFVPKRANAASNAEPTRASQVGDPVQAVAVPRVARHDIRHVPIAVPAERSTPRADPGYVAPTAIQRRPDVRPANPSYRPPPLQASLRPEARPGSGPASYRGDAAPPALAPSVPNRTGLPDRLKAGIETLSGLPMDGIRVHRNSAKAAAINARAYAQGRDIHLGPGQERHLPHEAWHVVQQSQGRVKPTMQAKGTAINDDGALEREATAMGAKAMAGAAQAGAQEPKPIASLEAEAGETTARTDGRPPGRGIANEDTATAPGAWQQAEGSPAPVQRVVLSKVYELTTGEFKIMYYSSYDGKTEFETKEEAQKHDTKKGKEEEDTHDPFGRVPTNVTYHRTLARNVLSNSNAGPHSLGHASLTSRLKKRIDQAPKEKLIKLRDQQISPPEEFAEDFQAEKPTTLHPTIEQRVLTDYELLYKRLDVLLKQGKNDLEVAELINRLMQADPYTAYGKGKKTGKKNIKHKGEREDDPFDKAFDQGAKFRSEEGYERYKKKRKQIYSSEEEFDYSEEEGPKSRKRKQIERSSDKEVVLSEDEGHEKEKTKRTKKIESEDSSEGEEHEKTEKKKTKKKKKKVKTKRKKAKTKKEIAKLSESEDNEELIPSSEEE